MQDNIDNIFITNFSRVHLYSNDILALAPVSNGPFYFKKSTKFKLKISNPYLPKAYESCGCN